MTENEMTEMLTAVRNVGAYYSGAKVYSGAEVADAITALRDKWIAAEAERDALRQLMLEARDWFHPRDPKVPGALVDMCDRIDAALKEGK